MFIPLLEVIQALYRNILENATPIFHILNLFFPISTENQAPFHQYENNMHPESHFASFALLQQNAFCNSGHYAKTQRQRAASCMTLT